MPFASDAQRRLVYAKSRAGEAWAKKFIADSHNARKNKRRRRKVSK